MSKNNFGTQLSTDPDSSGVRVVASGAVGRGIAPRPSHTKGDKIVPVAPLLTLATKGQCQEDTRRQLSIC